MEASSAGTWFDVMLCVGGGSIAGHVRHLKAFLCFAQEIDNCEAWPMGLLSARRTSCWHSFLRWHKNKKQKYYGECHWLRSVLRAKRGTWRTTPRNCWRKLFALFSFLSVFGWKSGLIHAPHEWQIKHGPPTLGRFNASVSLSRADVLGREGSKENIHSQSILLSLNLTQNDSSHLSFVRRINHILAIRTVKCDILSCIPSPPPGIVSHDVDELIVYRSYYHRKYAEQYQMPVPRRENGVIWKITCSAHVLFVHPLCSMLIVGRWRAQSERTMH